MQYFLLKWKKISSGELQIDIILSISKKIIPFQILIICSNDAQVYKKITNSSHKQVLLRLVIW